MARHPWRSTSWVEGDEVPSTLSVGPGMRVPKTVGAFAVLPFDPSHARALSAPGPDPRGELCERREHRKVWGKGRCWSRDRTSVRPQPRLLLRDECVQRFPSRHNAVARHSARTCALAQGGDALRRNDHDAQAPAQQKPRISRGRSLSARSAVDSHTSGDGVGQVRFDADAADPAASSSAHTVAAVVSESGKYACEEGEHGPAAVRSAMSRHEYPQAEHSQAGVDLVSTLTTAAQSSAEHEEAGSSQSVTTKEVFKGSMLPEKARGMTEAGKKISRALKGRRLSEERKQKISASLRGRKLSDEHRRKLSARFGGKNNPMFGRSLSAETRAKISRAMIASHDLRRPDQAKIGDDEETRRAPKVPKLLPPEVLKTVMESRLVSSLGKSGKLRQSDAAIDELLESVATGKIPPSAVRRMRNAAERARAERDSVAAANRVGTGKRRGRPPRNSHVDRVVDLAILENVQELGTGTSASKEVAIGARDRPMQSAVSDVSGGAGALPSSKTGTQDTKRRTVILPACDQCSGTGRVVCTYCVGVAGVASRLCPACMGAGTVFCSTCHGSGVLV